MPVALDFSRIIHNSRHVLSPEVGNIALSHLSMLVETQPEHGAYRKTVFWSLPAMTVYGSFIIVRGFQNVTMVNHWTL